MEFKVSGNKVLPIEEKNAKYNMIVMGSTIRVDEVQGEINFMNVDVTLKFSNGDRLWSDYETMKINDQKTKPDFPGVLLDYRGRTSSIIGDIKMFYRDYMEWKSCYFFMKEALNIPPTSAVGFLKTAYRIRKKVTGIKVKEMMNAFCDDFSNLLIRELPSLKTRILNIKAKAK